MISIVKIFLILALLYHFIWTGDYLRILLAVLFLGLIEVVERLDKIEKKINNLPQITEQPEKEN